MSERPPKNTSIYNQTLPCRRLRIRLHPRRNQPRSRRAAARTRLGGAVPHPGRVRGLRLRQPGRRGERDQPAPQPARLCGRRREHARHRLLGRRLRLLRAAAGPRRLRPRRDGRAAALGSPQPGRNGRRLLRRDQPALRRRDAAAASGRDHAALGDRQHRDDALSGRVPQHRLRAPVGRGPGRRLEARLADRGPGLGVQADPGGRSALQGEPDPPHRRRGPDREDPPQPLLPAEGRQPALARDVRQQDPRADLHGLSVRG